MQERADGLEFEHGRTWYTNHPVESVEQLHDTYSKAPDGVRCYVAGMRSFFYRIDEHWVGTHEAEVDAIVSKLRELQSERTETIAALREVCEHLGDNDWPDDEYLPDMIGEHLLLPILEGKGK